jgi:hypothetical protein
MEFSLQRFSRLAAIAVMGALAAGCTSGQSAVEPVVSQADLNANTLQFAVGTANIFGTSTGLNTVVTFRQSNGLSATLLNTPTITGPSGFVVNAAPDTNPTPTGNKAQPIITAGADSKTNHISGSAIPVAGAPFTATTFDLNGGAFAYGFAPENSTSAGSATYTLYRSPIYFVAPPPAVQPSSLGPLAQNRYVGGPPLYQNVRDGTFPTGFVGYSQGFVSFANVTLATGAYTLSVNIPATNVAPVTKTATGTLTSLVALPAIPAPVFAHAGTNGGSITYTAPAGTVETIAYVYDSTAGTFFSAISHTAGLNTVTIPDNLGAHAFGSPVTPTFTTGDKLAVYVVGFNYGAFEAGPPNNTSTTPTIVGANGQADITMSPAAIPTY